MLDFPNLAGRCEEALREFGSNPAMAARYANIFLEVQAGRIKAPGHTVHRDGVLYMRRHFLAPRGYWPQVWMHELFISDPEIFLHDHPWDYASIIASGGYSEKSARGLNEFREGSVIMRDAESAHGLILLPGPGPVLTLFIAGKKRRSWGFYTNQGWVESSVYLGAQA